MRQFFLVMGALIAACVQSADAFENNSVVTIHSVQSTSTIQGIAISSSTGTDVIISTGPLYRQICVQNLDNAAYLACSETVSVSTAASNALAGIVVSTAPTSGQNVPSCFEVVAGNAFYCRTSNTAGSSRAVIHRKR